MPALSPREAREGPSVAARDAARAGLYVHVPFCSRRCAYCDFASGAWSAALEGRWLAALEREAGLRARAACGLVFSSVFLGGGTPSVLTPASLQRALGTLRAWFAVATDAEVTLEANPESVEPRRVASWVESGVNRLSLGAQSFHRDELGLLGRIHAWDRPARAVALARAHGLARFSLDLIFGFPGHTLGRWRGTLDQALGLGPGHLSAYAFTAEPGTVLGEAVRAGSAALPSAEEQAEMYAAFLDASAAAGLGSYETSNVCAAGAEARHNLVYWLRRPYVGLGPSAHGFVGGERYGNRRALGDWAADLDAGMSPDSAREREGRESRTREAVMLGLRLSTGLRAADYAPAGWDEIRARYGAALAEAVASGRLEGTVEGFAVPRRLRFVADDAIAWIEARAEARGFDSRGAHSVPSPSCRNRPSSAIAAARTRT
jgi:oxygen-independent coproporphyrinogen-3 oxidase